MRRACRHMFVSSCREQPDKSCRRGSVAVPCARGGALLAVGASGRAVLHSCRHTPDVGRLRRRWDGRHCCCPRRREALLASVILVRVYPPSRDGLSRSTESKALITCEETIARINRLF